MNQPRPQNHVTRSLPGPASGPAFPAISEPLLKVLEDYFPPRCLRPNETVEDHLRYAGKVELIGQLRAEFDARFQEALAEHEADEEHLMANAERAR